MSLPTPLRLLVVCTGNRARSQMGEGWLRALGGERVQVASAGDGAEGSGRRRRSTRSTL